MQLTNQTQQTQDKGITSYLNSSSIQDYLQSVIGSNKEKFITNLVSVTNQNKQLQNCTNLSLMSGAIAATTLNLSLNSSFGYAYLVPFKNKHLTKERGHDVFEAQFQIGYKGYIQLALRTGEYHKLNAVPIYESQFISWDAVTESLVLNPDDSKIDDKVVGYVAFLRLKNGFEKTMYWSYDKMIKHADTYSQAFSSEIYDKIKNNQIPEKDMWKYSSFWYKSFDDMALKTMLRQLLSKYGIMGEEMQKAYEYDQSVIENNHPVYVDNQVIEKHPTPSIDAKIQQGNKDGN